MVVQIAGRVLKIRQKNGDREVPIRLFMPEQQEPNVWSCRYEIDWPHGAWSHEAWGVDSAQALIVALQLIGTQLYASAYHAQGALILDVPGRGYGFPVPPGLRQQLIGDDAKNF